MASKFSDLLLKISGDPSGAKAALLVVNRGILDAQRQTQALTGGFSRLAGSLQSIGTSGLVGLTAPIVGLGVAALTMAGKIESARTAFETMTGSAAVAASLLGEIRKFALTTPFQFPELIRSSQKLLGFGVAAESIVPTLRSIGNAVSAVGGGSVEIDRVTLALGQIKAKGKVSAEELNQLAETGLPVRDILAKGFNITQAALTDMITKGVVPADKAIRVLLDGFDGRFGGALEKQSKTLIGVFSNLRVQVGNTLESVGTAMAPLAKKIAKDLVEPTLAKIQELAKGFAELSPASQNIILGFTGITAAIPLLVGGLGFVAGGVLNLIGAYKALIPVAALAVAGVSAFIKVLAIDAAVLVGGAGGGILALSATLAGTAVAAGAAVFALYKLGEALLNVSAAQAAFDSNNKLAFDGINKVRQLALARGADVEKIKELDLAYKTHAITTAQYSQRLGEIVRGQVDVQGATGGATAKTQSFAGALSTAEKAAKELTAVNLPEWARFADMAFERLLATTPNLSAAMQDALRQENFTRATAAVKETTDVMYELITSGLPLAQAFKRSFATVVDGAKEYQKVLLQLKKVEDERAAQRVEQVPITKTLFEQSPFAAAILDARLLINAQEQLRTTATQLGRVYAIVAKTQGASSADGLQALRNWTEAEQKAAGVSTAGAQQTKQALLEVSTVTTNLAQALAANVFAWKGLKETALDALSSIGRAILSMVFENLLKSSGLITGLAKGLNAVLGKIPGIGKVFGGTAAAKGTDIATTAATEAAKAAKDATNTVLKGVGSAATSTLSSTISAVTGIGTLVTGLIGNVLAAKQGKDIARSEVTLRAIQSEVENLRADQWTRHKDIFAMRDSITTALYKIYDEHGAFLRTISEAFTGGARPAVAAASGGLGGGISIQIGNVYGGPAGLDQLADEIARRLGLKG